MWIDGICSIYGRPVMTFDANCVAMVTSMFRSVTLLSRAVLLRTHGYFSTIGGRLGVHTIS